MRFSTIIALTLLSSISTTQAAITTTGNVTPTAPSTWTLNTDAYIGYTSDGSLAIDGGSKILSERVYIGIGENLGTATISGANTEWTNEEHFLVGSTGTGIVNVVNGGTVKSSESSHYFTFIGNSPDSFGQVNITGNNSTFTNTSILYVGQQGTGEINLTNGGKLQNLSSCYIGNSTSGTGKVTVSGTDSTWVNGSLSIGEWGTGELNIIESGTVTSSGCHIGYHPNSTGTVSVSGPGSTWTNELFLYVGKEGSGKVNITDGGIVEVKDTTWVAYDTGSSGEIHFNNGTLTTGSFYANSNLLTGSGTINTNGMIADCVDLIFDTTHGTQQTLPINSNGQNIELNLNQNIFGDLGAGYANSGTLTIRDRVAIESRHAYLGYKAGSEGTATISDAGSTWKCNGNFFVGKSGSGTLNLVNGGVITNSSTCCIGDELSSTGIVTVSDTGSKLETQSTIRIGNYGTGSLYITKGGTVTAFSTSLGYGGDGKVDVSGHGSTFNCGIYLRVGNGGPGQLSINNGGIVNNSYGIIGNDNHQNPTSKGIVIVSGLASTWNNSDYIKVGYGGSGQLNILDGGTVNCKKAYLGYSATGSGRVTVSGTDSVLNNSSDLYVGRDSTGILEILDGATANNFNGYIGGYSQGVVTVSGIGSTWNNNGNLQISYRSGGPGYLYINKGGQVNVNGILINDAYRFQMSTGGKLALKGNAGSSLNYFLGMISGSGTIQWWDDSIEGWSPLNTATMGTDYTLEYLTEGDLAGYTLLTVGTVPEPGCIALIASTIFALGFVSTLRKYDQ